MEHKTWATRDKSAWGDGPWQQEPDKEQWQDEETGLPCLIVRNPLGALCGYVGVPEGHPWHGTDPFEIDVKVHGGLSYGSLCQEGPEGEAICHVPAPGEPEPLYWLGFDCSHAWDVCPAMDPRMPKIPDTIYKPVAYVKAECARLAAQAAAAVK